MSDRKPLVLDDTAAMQQLQSQDDLDIPLNERVARDEYLFRLLCFYLLKQGIDLPKELSKEANRL
jgi:hypothetical protein